MNNIPIIIFSLLFNLQILMKKIKDGNFDLNLQTIRTNMNSYIL